MRIIERVFDPVMLEESQAIAAMALPGDDVHISVSVPVHGVNSGHEHDGPRLNQRDSFRGFKLRLSAGSVRADVPVQTNNVLELAGHEVLPAVAVPIDQGAHVGTY